MEESKGHYVEPTVVTSLPYDRSLRKTELLVPILIVGKVKTLEEALMRADNVEYGLIVGIFGEDPKEIEYFFNNIEAGVVYANRTVGATTGTMPGVQPFGFESIRVGLGKHEWTLSLTLLPQRTSPNILRETLTFSFTCTRRLTSLYSYHLCNRLHRRIPVLSHRSQRSVLH